MTKHILKNFHLTSVRSRFDARIFLKEYHSLADAGYEASLVVSEGVDDAVKNGVLIYDVGKPKSHIDRMLNFIIKRKSGTHGSAISLKRSICCE